MQKLQWQYPQAFYCPDVPSDRLDDWLLDPGSFMRRLKQYGIAPCIRVLSERWEFLPFDERTVLTVSMRQYALVREIVIHSAEGDWMYARTVIPAATLTGQEKMLARLKNRSLGSVLFKNPNLSRSDFELSCLKPPMPWYEKIAKVTHLNHETIWARRSLLTLNKKNLLLTEVFLPAIERFLG